MRCVAKTRGQWRRADGRIISYAKGDVGDFEECPPFCQPIEGPDAGPIDFKTAGEQELLEGEYELADLKEFIEENYGKKPGNRGKQKMVELLLDCRYRSLDIDPNNMI